MKVFLIAALLVLSVSANTGDLKASIDAKFQELYAQSGLTLDVTEIGYFFNNYKQYARELLDQHETDVDKICKIAFEEATPATHSDLAEKVNQQQNLWQAHVSPRFSSWSIKQIKKLMGTNINNYVDLPARPEIKLDQELPENFDARQQWPQCPQIGHVRDQSNCGSCWAFGSTEALNDRTCIATNGEFKSLLSVQHTTTCCGFLQCLSMGCNGGQPAMAWKWFERSGVVTGGDFEDTDKHDTCQPYKLPRCAHHIEGTGLPDCAAVTQQIGSCTKSCVAESGRDFNQDAIKAENSGSIRGVDAIKRDLMAHGTVTAAFTVYDDFPSYKSGVYVPTSSKQLGGHAVKIIGWGKENGVDYWLVVNSWNEFWGDKGLFKIKMGTCGIDDMIVAGTVKAQKANELNM